MNSPEAGAEGADNVTDFSNAAEGTRELGGGWPAAILLALTFFVATAPTLSWLEFSASMENLLAATSLEVRRTGNWLVPTLEGEARIVKPPLATWISAAAIRSSTFKQLDASEPAERAAAYRKLAWEFRWPGLAASCLMLLAIFDLGKTIDSIRTGIFAMAIAGSTMYFFRYGRQATTDVHLALWTTVTMAALARLCLRGISWGAIIVAGVAAGLGFFSKGPPGLLQSVVPAMVFVVWRYPDWRRWRWSPLLVCAGLMLIVGGAWFAWVILRVPGAVHLWAGDITRAGKAEHTGNPFSYGTILIWMMPWSPLFVHGMIWAGMDTAAVARKRAAWGANAGWILMFVTIVIPVVMMSLVADREERYMLPLLGPFAVIAARSLQVTLDRVPGPKIPVWVQWAILFAIAIGLPVIGATPLLKRVDGKPWYSWEFASVAAMVMGVAMLVALVMARKRPAALVGATVLLMLMLQPIFYRGYRDMRQGRSEMRGLAELIRRAYPDALLYNWRPDSNKRASVDLSIYLNRPTIWTPDPAKLPTTTQPQVYVRLQNRGEPEPPIAPGWNFIAKVPRDTDWYLAFVREGDKGDHFARPADDK